MLPRLKSPSRKVQFAILTGAIAIFIVFGASYRANLQGESASSQTYPKGFRGGACTIETKALTVGYSSYHFSDEFVLPADAERMPYVPVQCGKVRGPGMMNIAIDLLYPESARYIPLALRLVKIDLQGKELELLSVPAQQHQSGVVTQAFRLSELGQYILYLEGKSAENKEFQVKIPLTVGLDWKDKLNNYLPSFLKITDSHKK